MDQNNHKSQYRTDTPNSARDYITLIQNNIKIIIMISSVILIFALIYAFQSKNVYRSSVTMRITEEQQNILQTSTGLPGVEYLDRFIANEIGVIGNYYTRERIARALIDSFKNSEDKDIFKLLRVEGTNEHRSVPGIANLLKGAIFIEQTSGTDVVEISAESQSPYEAALIANVCAIQYKELNLEMNRQHLTNIRVFLEKRGKEKLSELGSSEDTLIKFRERGGIVSLDAQSSGLINQLSQLDAQRDAAQIELMTSTEALKQYKSYLQQQDPNLVKYLENQTSQAYIDGLQNQIAELQVNKDMALSIKNPNVDISTKVEEYDKRIADLKIKLSEMISALKTNAFSTYPEQVRQIAQRLVEEEVNNSSLSVRLKQLETIINNYEKDFRKLPKTSIELAQYERKRESLQQLYTLIDQRYQEALINELSQPGNVFIIGEAKIPDSPDKPNRMLIIIFGLMLGPILSFFFLLVKDYFDDTVKTPEDIEKKNINFLTWLPNFNIKGNESGRHELIVINEPESPASESFRSVRARIQFMNGHSDASRLILVTSPAENEGKTVVAVNLASSFALSNSKTLLVDCDLRKPRIHSVMGVEKKPGLVEYLFNRASLDDIIKKTQSGNLHFITSGTIPPNPAEILESKAMKSFLEEMKKRFDIIILDSPPIVAVIDSEILGRLVTGAILVVSADKTEANIMSDAVDLIKRDNIPFIGTILNNFKNRHGSRYYYKYYYNYSGSSTGGKKNSRR